MGWYFLFFFVSGFCSILYEIIWLRLSMAQFGVTTALVSIVLSMFMAGLGLGSWGVGYAIRRYGERIKIPALRLYAFAELLIGISALAVPAELSLGRHLLERASISASSSYYLFSGAWIALTLIPWCACMGATIPLAMLAINEELSARSAPVVQLSLPGECPWRGGGRHGASAPYRNLRISRHAQNWRAAEWFAFCIRDGTHAEDVQRGNPPVRETAVTGVSTQTSAGRKPLVLLFLTGLTSMGAEVVWIRQFTPYLSTVVYAFASILGVYLAATFAGSRVYRYWSRSHDHEGGSGLGSAWICMPAAGAYLPVLSSQVRFGNAAAGAWHRTVFRDSGIRNTHAGGSLVGRRSGPGWPSLCGQCGGMHSRAAGRGIHPACL